MEIKRVVCKACGAKLEVKNSHNEPVKLIRCPSCKATLQVIFHQMHTAPEPSGSETLYVQKDPKAQQAPDEQSTVLAPSKPVVEQLPAFVYQGEEFRLNIGQNIVGRASKSGTATVPIPTADHTVSRAHALVNVIRLADGSHKAVIANYQNKNPIKVNGVLLRQGEELVLGDRAEVEMGMSKLIFLTKSSPA